MDKLQAADRLKQIEIEKAKLQKIINEKEALMKKNESIDINNSTKIKKDSINNKSLNNVDGINIKNFCNF